MKKIAKLSLVAAMAVAGLTNVNAASLEEAIKGVSVSGQFQFRAEEKNTTDTYTDVEIEIGVKVPVTENVTAVFKIDNANDDVDGSVAKGVVSIEDYYFSYNNGDLTVNAGQLNTPTRMTYATQGDGIVALYNLGSVTLGASTFMNTNIEASGAQLNTVMAAGTAGPISLSAQYADVADFASAFNVKADTKAGPVSMSLEYTEKDLDANNTENSTLKASASAKVGIVSGSLAFAKTGKDGAGAIQGANDAASEMALWQLGTATAGLNDTEFIKVNASVAITNSVSLSAGYMDADTQKETIGSISYKMAKNLSGVVIYSEHDTGAADTVDRVRVQAKYSF